jgi:hypothetical protein
LLRRLFRCLTAASLARLASLFLHEALLAAFQKLVLGDFAVTVGVNYLEVDNEWGGLVLRENGELLGT